MMVVLSCRFALRSLLASLSADRILCGVVVLDVTESGLPPRPRYPLATERGRTLLKKSKDSLSNATVCLQTILNKIRRFSKSHTIVHPGPAVFKDRSILPEGFTVDPKDVPGLSTHVSLRAIY
jgi:hypothetical protein